MKFLENASAMYFDQPYEGFLPSPLNIAVFTRVFVIDYYIVDLRFYFLEDEIHYSTNSL